MPAPKTAALRDGTPSIGSELTERDGAPKSPEITAPEIRAAARAQPRDGSLGVARPATGTARPKPAAETVRYIRDTPSRPITGAPFPVRRAAPGLAPSRAIISRQGGAPRPREEPPAKTALADGAPMPVSAPLAVPAKRPRGYIEVATPLQAIIGGAGDVKAYATR